MQEGLHIEGVRVQLAGDFFMASDLSEDVVDGWCHFGIIGVDVSRVSACMVEDEGADSK